MVWNCTKSPPITQILFKISNKYDLPLLQYQSSFLVILSHNNRTGPDHHYTAHTHYITLEAHPVQDVCSVIHAIGRTVTKTLKWVKKMLRPRKEERKRKKLWPVMSKQKNTDILHHTSKLILKTAFYKTVRQLISSAHSILLMEVYKTVLHLLSSTNLLLVIKSTQL